MQTSRFPQFILAASVALFCSFAAGPAGAAMTIALISTNGVRLLYKFDSARPRTLDGALAINGLNPGQTLVGIDYRPADSMLIGFGYNSTSGASGVYTISLSTGLATSINALTLSAGLARVMADFDPTPMHCA